MPNALPVLLLTEASAESHHSNPLVPEANELIWGAVSFLIFFAVMAKVAFPSINKIFVERTANIEGKLDEAEREHARAQTLSMEYQRKLDEAHAETQRIVEQARSNADRLEAELRSKAEEQAARIVERAQDTIRAERERAMLALRNEVGGLAVDLATRVVGNSLDRERQLQLVDTYINELTSSSNKSGSDKQGSVR